MTLTRITGWMDGWTDERWDRLMDGWKVKMLNSFQTLTGCINAYRNILIFRHRPGLVPIKQ